MDLSVVPLTHDKTLSMVFLPAGLLDGDVFFDELLPFFMDFCEDMMLVLSQECDKRNQ